MTEQDRDWLTLAEVAEHYRTPEATVRYWRHINYGPRGVRLGVRVLYQRAEIERFDRELAGQVDAETSAPSGIAAREPTPAA